MKVSIITVVFNGERTIADTISSVLSQDYSDIEYIIIDGGSKDNTNNIIQSYKDRISVYVSEPDKGLYDAMNKGISYATGEYIGILNADDFYADAFVVSKVVNQLKQSNCEGLYGDLDYVDPVDTGKVIRRWRAGSYTVKSFLFGWMPPHPTVFVKKEIYTKFGTFNLLLKSAADYEILLRLMHKHAVKFTYLPEIMIKMRAGGVSNASFKNRLRAFKEDKLAWKLNDIKPYFFTGFIKPIRKMGQFIRL